MCFEIFYQPTYLPIGHLQQDEMSNSNKSKKDKEILAEYESQVKGEVIHFNCWMHVSTSACTWLQLSSTCMRAGCDFPRRLTPQ